MRRGEIWFGDLGPPYGSIQAGRRPLVVLQNDALNGNLRYSLTVIVPVTTKGPKGPSDVRIEPDATNGLTEVSFAVASQPLTLSKDQLLRRLGKLDMEDLEKVLRGVDLAFGRL